MFRYRKSIKAYRSALKSGDCPFCHITKRDSDTIIHETPHAYVMKNDFAYDLWELRAVTDHLMVIPKRHVGALKELSQRELQEIMNIIADYETNGYNIYARALGSVQRTVPLHQHTHLIKTDNKQARGALFWRKPYHLFKV